jgi:hypothetical protein
VDQSEAQTLIIKIISTCEKLTLDVFSVIGKKSYGTYTSGYIVVVEPFMGSVFKQEIYSIVQKRGLTIRDTDNGIIIYSPRKKKRE